MTKDQTIKCMYDSWLEISSHSKTNTDILINDNGLVLKNINLEMIRRFSYWYIRYKYGKTFACWQLNVGYKTDKSLSLLKLSYDDNVCDTLTSLLSMAKEQNMEHHFGEIIFNYIKQYDYLFIELVDKINKIHNQMVYDALPWYKKIFRSSCG